MIDPQVMATQDPAPVATAVVEAPRIWLDPPTGLSGESVRVHAAGFVPEGWVSVFAGVRWLFNSRVDEHGGFHATVPLTRLSAPTITLVVFAYTGAEGMEWGLDAPERDLDATPLATAVYTFA